jgi:hypothetical protein
MSEGKSVLPYSEIQNQPQTYQNQVPYVFPAPIKVEATTVTGNKIDFMIIINSI